MVIDELGAGRWSKLFINNLLKGEFYLGTEFQGLPGLSLESVFSFALVFTCFSPRRSSGRLFVSFFFIVWDASCLEKQVRRAVSQFQCGVAFLTSVFSRSALLALCSGGSFAASRFLDYFLIWLGFDAQLQNVGSTRERG